MWSYNYSDDQVDYLAHKNGFKYIARIKQGKGFRYFYDVSEYKAYLDNKNQPLTTTTKKPVVNSVLSNIKNLISKGKKLFDISDKLEETLSDTKETIDKGRKKFLDFLDKQNQKKEEKKKEKEKELEEKKQAEQKKLDELREKEGTKFLDENLAHKEKEMTSDEDRQQVNPNYSPYDYGYSNNCAYCTAAWDLRRRGYDVEAESVTPDIANTDVEVMSWYEPTPEPTDMFDLCEDFDIYVDNYRDGQFVNTKEISDGIKNDILKQGDGARGTFLLYWAGGGGHSVAYEVRNNDVVLIDSQVNETLDIEDYIVYANDFEYFRLDNCKPNEKILKTCRNAKRR